MVYGEELCHERVKMLELQAIPKNLQKKNIFRLKNYWLGNSKELFFFSSFLSKIQRLMCWIILLAGSKLPIKTPEWPILSSECLIQSTFTATGMFYEKKVFSKILQNVKKIPVLRSLFKKRLLHSWFTVNFANFLKAPFLQSTSGRPVLHSAQPLTTKYVPVPNQQ